MQLKSVQNTKKILNNYNPSNEVINIRMKKRNVKCNCLVNIPNIFFDDHGWIIEITNSNYSKILSTEEK